MIKNTITYLVGNVLAKIIVIVLLPIYSKFISPDSYGYFDIVTTYIGFAGSVVCMEVWTAVLRFILESTRENEKYVYVQNGMAILLCSITIFEMAIYLFSCIVPVEYLALVMIYAMVLCIQNYYTYLARGYQKNLCFAVSGIISASSNVVINVILIVYLGIGYSSLYYSFIISGMIQCIYLETNLRTLRNFQWGNYDFSMIKMLLKFAWPFGINVALYWFLNSYSKTVLIYSLGPDANGYFTVASKFGAIIQLLASCVILAWQEKAFDKGIQSGADVFYSEMTNSYIRISMCCGCITLPAIYIIFPFLVDAQYSMALALIPPYIVATVISVFSSFLTAIFVAIKKTSFAVAPTLIGATANVLSVHGMINKYGIQSATISMIIGYAVCVTVILALLRKLVDLQIDVRLVAFVIVPMYIVSIASFYSNSLVINVLAFITLSFAGLAICKKQLKSIFFQILSAIRNAKAY